MSDINKRLNELERVAKANKPNEGYKNLYPLMPLEFTKLIKQDEPEQALAEMWHEVVEDYEQEHQAELQEYLKANDLPPWRRLLDLTDRTQNGGNNKPQTKGRGRELESELTNRALKLYERRKSEGKI